MIVSFFGHADFTESLSIKSAFLSFLETLAPTADLSFYIGTQGAFDAFALSCCFLLKRRYPHVKTICITPYLTVSCRDNRFDEYIYPALEHVPPRFAIVERNRFMVRSSDLILTYIDYPNGGAYQALCYASKLKKPIKNFGKWNDATVQAHPKISY